MIPMKIAKYRVIPLVLLALVAGLAVVAGVWLIVTARQPLSTSEYFSVTRHNVRGEFLNFFRENGGLATLGYPITEEFLLNGRLVQYFQRARMELNPESDTNRVELGKLAVEMGLGTGAIPESQIPPASDPTRRYFPETGHTVELPFLRYFNDHGGVDFFGYPITEVTQSNGRSVQYFERARMDLYPDRPLGQQVQLADLGESHFIYAGLDYALRRGVDAIPAIAAQVLHVEASVADPYAAAPQPQTLFVNVKDENDKDVAGVAVSFTVEYPGAPESHTMGLTGENGSISTPFQLKDVPVGHKLMIHITATLGAVIDTTTVSSVPRR